MKGIKKSGFLRSDVGLEGRLQYVTDYCHSVSLILTYLNIKNFIAGI